MRARTYLQELFSISRLKKQNRKGMGPPGDSPFKENRPKPGGLSIADNERQGNVIPIDMDDPAVERADPRVRSA